MPDDAAIVLQGKADIGTRQGDALEGFLAVGEFGGLAFQKFAAGGRVEIQLADVHGRASALAGWRGRADSSVQRLDLPAVRVVGSAAAQSQLRHGGHAGQRFAAKAHAGNALQIVKGSDFAGGVAQQRQRQVGLADAAPVVAHQQAFDAALFQLHANLGRSRIQAVFQQFLECGGGAFDDLASSDLVDQQVR